MLRRRSKLVQRIQRHSSFATLYQGAGSTRETQLAEQSFAAPQLTIPEIVQAKRIEVPADPAITSLLSSPAASSDPTASPIAAAVPIIAAPETTPQALPKSVVSRDPLDPPPRSEPTRQTMATTIEPFEPSSNIQRSPAETHPSDATSLQPDNATPALAAPEEPPDPVWDRLQAIMRLHEGKNNPSDPADEGEVVQRSPASASRQTGTAASANQGLSVGSEAEAVVDVGAENVSGPRSQAGDIEIANDEGIVQRALVTPEASQPTTRENMPRAVSSDGDSLSTDPHRGKEQQSTTASPVVQSENPAGYDNDQKIVPSPSQSLQQPLESGKSVQASMVDDGSSSSIGLDTNQDERTVHQESGATDSIDSSHLVQPTEQVESATPQTKPTDQQRVQLAQSPDTTEKAATQPTASLPAGVNLPESQLSQQGIVQRSSEQVAAGQPPPSHDDMSTGVANAGPTKLHQLQDVWPVQRKDGPPTAPQQNSASAGGSHTPSVLGGESTTDQAVDIVSMVPTSKPTHSEIEIVPPRRPRPIFRKAEDEVNLAKSLSPKAQDPPASISTEIGELPSDLWTIIDEPIPGQATGSASNPASSPSATTSQSGAIQAATEEGANQQNQRQSDLDPLETPENRLKKPTPPENFQPIVQRSEIASSSVAQPVPRQEVPEDSTITVDQKGTQGINVNPIHPKIEPRQTTPEQLTTPSLATSRTVQRSEPSSLSSSPSHNPLPLQDAIMAATRQRDGVQQTGEPDQALVARQSVSANNYQVESARTPVIQREPDTAQTNGSSLTGAFGAAESGVQETHQSDEEMDIDKIARLVYERLRRRMVVEWERLR